MLEHLFLGRAYAALIIMMNTIVYNKSTEVPNPLGCQCSVPQKETNVGTVELKLY